MSDTQLTTAAEAITAPEPAALTGDEILANARALGPWLRERAAEIEDARRLPPEVVGRLREAGVFRMNMPRSWGGPEMTPMQQNRVIEEISRGSGSAGWCTMIGADSGLYSAYLDPSVARQMFPRLDMVMAGFVYPVGKAERVAGGYRVTGRWPFGSGCTHADWLAAGCLVYENGRPATGPDQKPLWRVVIAKPREYTIHDTWRTTGLRGTGSHDYEADGLFVPDERTFSFSEGPRRPTTLYRKPDTFLRKMAGIPLGMAREAIDFVVAQARTKFDMPAMMPYGEVPRVQWAVSDAEIMLGSARAYVYESLEAQWAKLDAGEEPTKEERAAVFLARMSAFQTSRKVVALMYDTVGGSAIYADKGPLDRLMRDATTACQHLMGQPKIREWAGELLLTGKCEDAPFL